MNPVWTVRVGLARDRSASVRARSHGLVVGQPLDFGASAAGASALEVFLGAVGSDVLLRFCDLCERRRIPVDQAEVRIDGRLGNALVALGVVGEEGDPGLAEVAVAAAVASPSPEEEIRAVWEAALARSPLFVTLERSTTLRPTLQIL
ncbi:MAG: hypothetical protein SNJ76_11775 [Fimbriimonadaceae bacterium]